MLSQDFDIIHYFSGIRYLAIVCVVPVSTGQFSVNQSEIRSNNDMFYVQPLFNLRVCFCVGAVAERIGYR